MSEKKFQWDDESVLDFCSNYYRYNSGGGLEDFKKEKEKQLVSKDFEIISYKHLPTSEHIGRSVTVSEGDSNFENAVKGDKDYVIFSVRRNKDKEVFSVGGKCFYEITDSDSKTYFTITKIENRDSRVLLYQNDIPMTELNSAKKVKQPIPLFTTEEGKEIFENDTFWFVAVKEDSVFCNDEKWSFGSNTATAEKTLPITNNYKYFSTEDAAKEYILMNKPVLSLNDLLDNWEGLGSGSEIYKGSEMFTVFRKVAEKKINV